MTAADFIALSPWLVLMAAALVLLLVISFYRSHRLTVVLTVLGLVFALASIPYAAQEAPRMVTPLLSVDGFSLYFLALILLAALAVVLLAYGYTASREAPREEFYLLLLIATLGAAVLVGATHYASLLLGLETLSVALFALAAYYVFRDRPMEAGIKYLILAGVAVAFLLFGVALIYARTGSLELGALTEAAATGAVDVYLATGIGLVIVGLAFKLSLVPFHLWTPDVYEGAPPPVAAFLATVSKGAAFAVVMRFLLATEAHAVPSLLAALTLIGLATMLAGNLLALLQDDLKRILAYSSIAHMGYLLVPLAGGGELGIETVGYYLAAYFVMNLAAFGVVTQLEAEEGGEQHDLTRYRRLLWRRPLLATVLAAALFALAGMPLTVGFIAKFYLFAAGVDGGLWLLLAALVIGSAIGLFYYLRVVLYLVATDSFYESVGRPRPGVWAGHATLWLLLALLVVFGVYPAPLIGWVRGSALSMIS
ncbi:MAG: NADH-quinone oxidoreductase subunit N [Halofilum sp. (in: g-proteobacteria)]